jgi:hypothetical protein
MHSYTNRGRPLALRLAALTALTALAACADAPPATGPVAPLKPHFGIGPILTVTNTSGGTGTGSLRWAARQATVYSIILFDPSLAGATITLDSTLRVGPDVTIEGPQTKGITISGGGTMGVMDLAGGAAVRNLTITSGKACVGGGIVAWNGHVTVEHSTVTGNRAECYEALGGGIYADSLTLVNSTVTGNSSRLWAGAIFYRRHLTMINSTVSHNTAASGQAGGIDSNNQSTGVLRNSIIAVNSGFNCQTWAPMTYEGRNLSDNATCGSNPNMLVGDPLLSDLADNGGPSKTRAFAFNSPALNAGTNCNVTADQRYVARDAACDLGAFEFTDFTTVTLTIDPNTRVDATGRALLTGTLKCTRNDSFRLALELHQDQNVNGQVVDVHSASDIPVNCTTTRKSWSATMVLSNGEAYQAGTARATAQTLATPKWVTPAGVASGVKISLTRK